MKITIARECGCYGDEVGQVLADRLNVPLYNKKTLTELAKKKGILEHYPDYFGENPAGTLLAVIAEDDGEDSVVHRTPRKVLDELIGETSCILIGRAGNYAYQKENDVVRVFLSGDRESRIHHLMEKHKVEVIAIGNPLGELTFTMTAGVVSALDREINTDGKPINMLQTDVAINSGNSGGALFNMYGEVVGITNAKYGSSSSSSGTASIEGISFAIPINDALRVVYDLQQYGHVTGRAYLGVTVKDLDSTTAATYGLPTGPMIQSVEAGGCAEKAGLQQGDIIIGFNGAEISSYTDLVAALNKCHSGDTATIKVFRSGAEVDATITLDERPTDEEVASQQQAAQDQQQSQNGQSGSGSNSNGSNGYSYGYGNVNPFEYFQIPGFGN